MLKPLLPYNGYSIPQLEDLMQDATEEQEQMIVIELARRGCVKKRCMKCQIAIGHGNFCKKHSYMSLASITK